MKGNGTGMREKIRLHVEGPLGAGQEVLLPRPQSHYLAHVLRRRPGDRVGLFNGRDGEWRADIGEIGKAGVRLHITEQIAPQGAPPDLWLVFAPVKKARTDFVVEKAVELGAARILPVRTRFTNTERLKLERLRSHAVEAAEQCGATWVPEIAALTSLESLLADWPEERQLFFADERLAGTAAPVFPPAAKAGPAAVLIGPEGGFSAEERARLHALPAMRPLNLGPRILRAETAAVAALALWQARFGDWQGGDSAHAPVAAVEGGAP